MKFFGRNKKKKKEKKEEEQKKEEEEEKLQQIPNSKPSAQPSQDILPHERVADPSSLKNVKSILKTSNTVSKNNSRASVISTVWKLSESQMEECEDVFSVFADENELVKDVHIGKMFKAIGYNPKPEELEEIIVDLKERKGGKMDFSTFVQTVAPHIVDKTNEVYYSDEKIKLAFERFDLDNDGYISASELRIALSEAFCQGMKRVAETLDDADVEEVIAEADLDGDGRISFDEFRTMIPHLSVGVRI
jgi:calmodulin